MPLSQRMSKKIRSFDLPVSFKMGETGDRLRDALNVFSNQGRLETRFGRERFNATPLPSAINSLSFFEHANGDRHLIAKAGTSIYSVDQTGAHTELKSGLNEFSKHRGVTWARGSSSRQIIALDGDGLYQFDGEFFSPLGQDPPSTPTIALTTGTMTNGAYRVGITFYSSKTGFETNLSTLSNTVTTSGGASGGLAIADIPATALNKSIDKVYIYLKKPLVGDPVYVGEVNLGTTTFNITSDPLSVEIPPRGHAKPIAGGARYIAEFNRRLVYAGNSDYPNDVYFSEPDLPDAFNDGTEDDRLVLYATLDGPITGLATGLYNNSVLDPFLVVFKRRSTHIYSEINGEGKFIPISSEIGCVSHDTIRVKNGVIYFLSEQGWRILSNGSLLNDQQGNPATLGNGDIDDIFRSPGYAYEANQSQLVNAFSVYYSTLDQYMTWVAEGGNNDFSKTYVYEFKINGFKPYQFLTPATAACSGQEATGEVVYMADAEGVIYRHSTAQDRSDEDAEGIPRAYESFGVLTWLDGDDLDASYNFRELILRRMAGAGDMTARIWINFDMDSDQEINFENPLTGFVLDVSVIDVDTFGASERSIVTGRSDINRVGENIMIGFYQSGINKNIGLVAAQVELSKNGNRNI
jgi:hypothetical protein